MRIAMILPSLANTGPGIVVRELCQALVARGHLCKVFYFDDIVELKMPCPVARISFWKRFNIEDWDVIHSHMIRPDLYVRLHTLFKKYRVNFVSTLHNPISYKALRTNYSCLQSLIGTILWKFALTAFHHVVVLNPYTCSVIKGVNKNKLEVIYNGRDITPSTKGCDKADVEVILKLKKKYTLIGTISSITYRKGLEQIINALPLLPNYAFIAVGAGDYLNRLKRLAELKGVSDRCYWTGYRREGASDYQSYFDIFLMCSRSEGFPLALIEAAAYGKPTVLSNIQIFKSIVSKEEVVFYSSDNIISLAESIEYINKYRSRYSHAIYQYYQKMLTANVMVNNYLSLYKK